MVESLGGEHNVSGRSSAYGDTGHESSSTTLREGATALPSTMQVSFFTNSRVYQLLYKSAQTSSMKFGVLNHTVQYSER